MDLKSKIRVIEDFPVEGISFKDITTLLKDPEAYREAVDRMAEDLKGSPVDLVAAPESRGFIFGSILSYSLGAGFVPFRKPGKLPAEKYEAHYSIEYGENVMEVHKDAVKPGQKVVIVDDLLATGGTALAMLEMLEKMGAEVIGFEFLIELTDLKGRELLKGYPVRSLITYNK